MRSARLLRALGFGALICLDVAAAAGVAAAVGPDEGRGGTFWGAVVVVILLLAGLAYLTIRAASELGLDRRQLGSRALWRHGWKVSLIPLFFHVPDDVKYLCGTILCASLVVDLVLEVPEQRLREWVGAAFGAAAVLNFLSEVAGIEGQGWHLVRVVVGLAFLVTFCAWLGSLLSKRAAPSHALPRD